MSITFSSPWWYTKCEKISNANEHCEFCHRDSKSIRKVELTLCNVYFRCCNECWRRKRRLIFAAANKWGLGRILNEPRLIP